MKMRRFSTTDSQEEEGSQSTFRILRARWRIFGRPIKATVINVERYLLALIALHNYLQKTENASYCPTEFVDCESSSRIIKPGEWRSVVDKDIRCLRELSNVRGSRSRILCKANNSTCWTASIFLSCYCLNLLYIRYFDTNLGSFHLFPSTVQIKFNI